MPTQVEWYHSLQASQKDYIFSTIKKTARAIDLEEWLNFQLGAGIIQWGSTIKWRGFFSQYRLEKMRTHCRSIRVHNSRWIFPSARVQTNASANRPQLEPSLCCCISGNKRNIRFSVHCNIVAISSFVLDKKDDCNLFLSSSRAYWVAESLSSALWLGSLLTAFELQGSLKVAILTCIFDSNRAVRAMLKVNDDRWRSIH